VLHFNQQAKWGRETGGKKNNDNVRKNSLQRRTEQKRRQKQTH